MTEQTIHIAGLSQKQLDVLEHEGFVYTRESGITLLHLSVTKNLESNMTDIGRIIWEHSEVKKEHSLPEHTS
jgi:hypothetical protein